MEPSVDAPDYLVMVYQIAAVRGSYATIHRCYEASLLIQRTTDDLLQQLPAIFAGASNEMPS